MGLLDDAIREHLEPKRRHGADPDEVARQEHEALGAAVAAREAEEAPAEAAEEPPPEDVAAVEAPTRVVEPDEAALDEPAVPDAPTQEHEVPEPEPQPGYEEDPWLVEEEADEEMAAAEEEDVLEETPEFLQETPEHDRLWFEQRPPRDFDWDK
jgi:hypothetical protein